MRGIRKHISSSLMLRKISLSEGNVGKKVDFFSKTSGDVKTDSPLRTCLDEAKNHNLPLHRWLPNTTTVISVNVRMVYNFSRKAAKFGFEGLCPTHEDGRSLIYT